MAKDLFYKLDGIYYKGDIDPYIVQTEAEVAGIAAYPEGNAQAAVILGDGSGLTVKIRLPGGEWTTI